MLYNDYYRRMSKVMTFARSVKKHLLVILLSVFAVLAIIATLLATRGLVYDKSDCPEQVEYGQSIDYTAGAFLAGDVSYEYRADGSTEWSNSPPTRAGKYYVRAVSSRVGGAKSYGNEHAVTVLPKKIDVTVGGTTVFGENPSVAAELSYGDSIDCAGFVYADPSLTATTVTAVASAVVITDENGEDVTDCYDISTPTCPIVFTPRKIGITVADKTVEYDNTPKAFGGYELSSGTLADGNVIVCVADATLTEVGEIGVTPEFRVLNGDGVDVSANYDISRNTGKISVTQRIVRITSKSAERVYDGNVLSCADYDITDGTSLVSGHRLSLELHSSITDAGSSDNVMAFKVFDGDKDMTSNYSIVLTVGKLTVTPRPITVKTVDKAWEYDGAAHGAAAVVNDRPDGLLNGHSLIVDNRSAVITDVGTADNAVTVKVQTLGGTDVSSNYKIDYDLGTLTVTPKALNVTSADGQFTYDGAAHGAAAVESAEGLIDGHKAQADTTVGAYATITDVGTLDNGIAVIVSDANGADKTANYTIRITPGTLTMNPRPITVKAANDSREYDGTPFTSNSYEIISVNKLVAGHIGAATCVGERTEIGTAQNSIVDFKVFDGEADITHCYDVSFSESNGTLTVTPREITVKSADGKFTYDGTAKSKNEIDSVARLVDGHTISVVNKVGAYATITDAGTADNDIIVAIVDGNGIDKTGSYKIIHVHGTLTVMPRPVTVKSTSLSKVYDGTPLKGGSNDFTVTAGNFVLDHKGRAVCKSEQTDVGESLNEIAEVRVFSGDTEVTKNYSISVSDEKGKLEVTRRPITVKAGSGSKIFDGTPLTSDDFAVTSDLKIVDGQHGVASCLGAITEVGTADNTINHTFKVYLNDVDKTANYSVAYDDTPGVLTVTPRPILVRTAAHTFIYDGDDHDWKDYGVEPKSPLASTDMAIVGGHHTAVVESTITKVNEVMLDSAGEVIGTQNIFEIVVLDDNDYDKTHNYDIHYIYNSLLVRPRPIVVTTESQEFLYDDTDHSHAEYSIGYLLATDGDDKPIIDKHIDQVKSLTTVHDVMRISESVSDSEVIGTDNDITIKITDKSSGADKTFNYNIVYVYGELKVNPRPITVISGSQEFMYDDTDHYYKVYEITKREPLKESDDAVLGAHKDVIVGWSVVREAKRDGYYANVITIAIRRRANNNDETHNYDIKYVDGKLTVNPRPIEIITGSQSWIFDGMYHSNTVYDAKALFALNDGETALAGGHKIWLVNRPIAVRDVKRDEDGNVIGYENNSELKIVRESDNAVTTDNYDIIYTYGTLTITPRHITVRVGHDELTGGVNSWVYDGNQHSDTYIEVVDTVCSDAPSAELTDTGLLGSHYIKIILMYVVTDVKDDDNGIYDNKTIIGIYSYGDYYEKDNYEIHYIEGKLQILPRPITVKTATRVWKYDGKAHADYYLTVDRNTPLAEGHRAIRREGSVCEIKDIGKKDNVFDVDVFDQSAQNVTQNYDINFVYGKLSIQESDDNGDHGGGDIGGGDLGGGGDDEPTVLFTISTNYNGHIFLRQNSYGDYVLGRYGVSFLDAEEFNGLFANGSNFYGMNYMPTTILENSVAKYYVNVELVSSGYFVVPYFAAFGDTAQIQTSDVWYYLRGNSLSYTVNFHPYMYTSDNGAALGNGVDNTLSFLEREYYSYVLSKYLQIPASTKSYLDSIIAAQRFSTDDPNIISKVAAYIQNSAVYNLKYNTKLDSERDIVVEFLKKYKDGVCRHYAAAATMLYRALGIPARYVCGVSANGDGTGNPIQVTSDRAHAWTEVYIAGAGWVPIEVTGSDNLSGGGSIDGDGGFIPSLTIKPIDVYVTNAPAKPINAVIQTAGSIDLNFLIKNQGFYYDVVVEETSPGVSEIKSFKLYNRVGMDVTSELEGRITFLPGKLVVTGKKYITVEMSRVEQMYNGMPLELLPDDYTVLDAPAGFTVTLELSGISLTAAGKVTTEGLRDMLDAEYGKNMWYTVLNAEGIDVTGEYFISFIGDTTDEEVVEGLKSDTSVMMVLEISTRRVTFTSLSKSKKYDGTPLEAEITYSQSELAAGHKAIISQTVSITDVGEEESTFIVQIVDANGIDVTANYLITKNIGNLTVTE